MRRKNMTSRIVTKLPNGKNNVKKFTILDSQNALFMCGRTVSECEDKIYELRNQQTNVQPFVIIAGEKNNLQYLVYIDCSKFICESIGHAIDCCFKIMFVLSLKYPSACMPIWHFIQHYFYDLYKPHDNVFPSSSQLIKMLSKS